MQQSIKQLSFGDIVSKNKMIEQLKQSGKIPVRVTFHYDTKNASRRTMMCDQNQPLMRLNKPIREYFLISENDGLFFYINKKIPDQNKSIKALLQLSGGDALLLDVANSQIF